MGKGRADQAAVETWGWQGARPGPAYAGPCLGDEGVPVLLGAEGLITRSYLAGVDAALGVPCTQVAGVDDSRVPPAAVAELRVHEVDLGLLQHHAQSLSCGHRGE